MSSYLGHVRSHLVKSLRKTAARIWTVLRPGVIAATRAVDTQVGIVPAPVSTDRYRRPLGLRRR